MSSARSDDGFELNAHGLRLKGKSTAYDENKFTLCEPGWLANFSRASD
jgi:hypothetical protein